MDYIFFTALFTLAVILAARFGYELSERRQARKIKLANDIINDFKFGVLKNK